MDFSNADRAEVLTQALPYIKRYTGKTVVVKYGGNAMINETLKQQVMEDIVLLWLIGVKIVLIHGGGPEISELMKKVGKESVFVDGLRVTDKESMEIVQMVLAGKVNKTLVNLLEMKGGRAVGLSGIDGRIIESRIKNEKLGFVGEITKINPKTIEDLLSNGYIPVISTIGCDASGNTYNINGDTAAAHIAGALNAERLALLPRRAVVVNVGRGATVDQAALEAALRSGAISAAGLDVTDPEPLPADSTLWDAPNLLLTPHAAGGRVVGAVERIIANAAAVEATPLGEPITGLEAQVPRSSR